MCACTQASTEPLAAPTASSLDALGQGALNSLLDGIKLADVKVVPVSIFREVLPFYIWWIALVTLTFSSLGKPPLMLHEAMPVARFTLVSHFNTVWIVGQGHPLRSGISVNPN